MNPNDYYNLLMDATKGNKSHRYYSDDLQKQKEKQYKDVSSQYDNYRDETGAIHIGDEVLQDNQDLTFTDSTGKKVSIDEVNTKLREYNEKKAAPAEGEGGGFLEGAGNFFKGVGETIADGATGAVDFTLETGRGIKNLVDTRGEMDRSRKFYEERDAYLKQFLGDEEKYLSEMEKYNETHKDKSGDTSRAFKEQGENAERFDDAGKRLYNAAQYVPGVSLGAETAGGIIGAIAGEDSEIAKRQMELTQNIEDYDALSDEEKEQAKAMRAVGGALGTLDVVMPGAKVATQGLKIGIKEGVKAGGKAAAEAYSKTVLAQNVKDVAGVGVKELAKQSVKSTAGGTVVGAGLGVGLNAAMGGDNWQDAAVQGAVSGAIGGFLGSPLDVSTGKAATKQAIADAEVKAQEAQMTRIKKEMEDSYLQEQFRDNNLENRVLMLEDTNPRTEATTLADGSPIASNYQRDNVNRLNEIQSQLDDFSVDNSKLSGEQVKALTEERKSLINEINSEYDARTNTGQSSESVNAELRNIANGGVPDDATRPITQLESATDIIGKKFFDDDMQTAALEIVDDANKVTEVLDNLMTQQRFNDTADALDVKYNADIERISKMPARRQERELAKLDAEYEAELNRLDAELQDAAPAVEEYSNMLAFLKSKEDQLVVLARTMAAENPSKAVEVDPVKLEAKTEQLIAQQKVAEVSENAPAVQMASVGSVTNGIRPSENSNPRVVAEMDDARVANDNINTGVNPGIVSRTLTAPRHVMARWGENGKRIAVVLDEAHDSLSIADQQVAVKTLNWTKAAGGKKGMREIAKALDGDMEAFSALKPEQQQVYSQVRDMFAAYADNLELPEGARIKDYLPHIFNNKPLDQVDSAIMRLTTGRNLDGTPMTAKEISEANKVIKGVDFETLQMIRKNSMYEVKNGFLKKRTGVEDYSFELAEIIQTYTHAAHSTMYLKPAFQTAKELSPTLTAQQNDYLARVIAEVGGRPTESLGSLIDESLNKIFKNQDSAYSHGSAVARKLVYDALLGFNPAAAIRNLSQGANTFAKLGTKYTARGSADAIASFKHSTGLYDELVDSGVLMNRYSDLLREGKAADLQRNFDGALWKMFSSVEQFNRATAYFGAKQRYIDKYVKSASKKGVEVDVNNLPDDVLEAAKRAGRDMSRKTQFEFGAMDIPIEQQSTTAKNLIQFQSYNLAQVNFLKNMFVGDTDSLFVKSGKGKYKLSGEGAMQLARFVGANVAFIYTIGQAIGMSPEDQVPFFDNTFGAEETTDIIPRSPLTKLLIGDGKGGTGLTDLVLGAKNAITDKKVREKLPGDALEWGIDAASSLIPGGGQAKKTIEGVISTTTGESTNASGKIRFLQDQDFSSQIRAGLFGQYQTDAGREWVKDGFPTFSEAQTSKIREQETMNAKERYADMYIVTKGRQDAVDEIKETYENQGTNAAMRKTQEWNAQQDAAIAEYRKKHPGALPKEIADALNKSKINYSNLRMNSD